MKTLLSIIITTCLTLSGCVLLPPPQSQDSTVVAPHQPYPKPNHQTQRPNPRHQPMSHQINQRQPQMNRGNQMNRGTQMRNQRQPNQGQQRQPQMNNRGSGGPR